MKNLERERQKEASGESESDYERGIEGERVTDSN